MRFFSILLKWFESRTFLMTADQRAVSYFWLEQFKKRKKTIDTWYEVAYLRSF